MARAKRSRGPQLLLLLVVIAVGIAVARKERLVGGLGKWSTPPADAPPEGTNATGPGSATEAPGPEVELVPDPETKVPTPEMLRARGYSEEIPEHVVAGVVLEWPGSTPLANAQAGVVHHVLDPEERVDLPFDQRLVDKAPLDAEGRFRFEYLRPGRYEIQIRIEGEEPRALAVEQRLSIQRREAQVIVLGKLELTGRVFGNDGKPAAGVRVRLTREATGGGSGPVVTDLVTDADGYCRATRLLPGDCWLTAYLDPESKDPADRPSVHALVVAEGRNTRNVGWPGPRRTVAGVVRFADGSSVPGPGLVRVAMPSGDGGVIVRPFDAQGRFEVPVPMGAWQIQAHMPGHLGRVYPMASFALEAPDLQIKEPLARDVIVDDARVEVRLVGASTDRRYVVRIRQAGSDWTRTIQAHDPARIAVTGLEPGEWRLSVQDPVSQATSEETKVTVAADTTSIVRLDLPVPKPDDG